MRPNSSRNSGLGKRWLLAVLVVSAAVAPSLGQMRRVEKGSLEVIADRTAYEAGTEARLAAVMAIESGWHTNSHKPTYDYLIGTDVRVDRMLMGSDWPHAEGTVVPRDFITETLKGLDDAELRRVVWDNPVELLGVLPD